MSEPIAARRTWQHPWPTSPSTTSSTTSTTSLASDDHVIALGTAVATKDGSSLTYRTAEIYHVKNGQVTERWAFSDDTKAITDFFG